MKTLTKKQVMLLHTLLSKKTGGDDGLRDDALLDSALQSAYATFVDKTFLQPLNKKRQDLALGL